MIEIHIEPQREAHAVEMFPLLQNPELYEFIEQPPPEDEGALRRRFKRLEKQRSPDGTEIWLNWIVRRNDSVAVGYVQSTVYEDHTADIAFVLGRQYWGRGYATEGSRLMIDELKSRYGVRKMSASVDPRNLRSISVLSRLGFAKRPQLAANGDVLFDLPAEGGEAKSP